MPQRRPQHARINFRNAETICSAQLRRDNFQPDQLYASLQNKTSVDVPKDFRVGERNKFISLVAGTFPLIVCVNDKNILVFLVSEFQISFWLFFFFFLSLAFSIVAVRVLRIERRLSLVFDYSSAGTQL